jgi:two-component system chemotaxis response regulator CheY
MHDAMRCMSDRDSANVKEPEPNRMAAATPTTPVEYQCLIVEDSPMMRQLLVFALSRVKQLKVTEADDGVDGLKKLAAGKFDIILTDINMPIMDGLKLVKRVRTDPVHKDVPIVIITTESAEEDRQRALSLGANAYITKPIQAPQVIAKVRELLGIEAPPSSSMP